mgnify:CR=1 FL=1
MPADPRHALRLALAGSWRLGTALVPHGGCVKCPNSSHSPTADQIQRYRLAQERFFSATKHSLPNGPTTPPIGSGSSPTGGSMSSSSSTGLSPIGSASNDLFERLARLATTPRPDDSCPLVTYTTEAGPHGDVVKATPGFIEYMRRTVDGYRVEGVCDRPVPSGPAEGAGGKPRKASWMT